MSIAVMSQVWEKSKFRGTDLLCLLALADWADDEGYSWHNIDNLASKIRVTRRQTIKILNKLSTEMELVVHRNVAWKGANLYWVAVGVNSWTPPPEILGLTVLEPPTYRGSTLVRGALLESPSSPESSLTVIDDGDDNKVSDSSPPEDSVKPPTPPVSSSSPPILDPVHNGKLLDGFLRASRVGREKRKEIVDSGALASYVQKWFVYAEIRGFDVGLAIVNVLDELPEPEFCDFCAGPDGNHKRIGIDSWGEECPRANNGKLTTKECEEMTGVSRNVHLIGVE
jgi:hypothetical protein